MVKLAIKLSLISLAIILALILIYALVVNLNEQKWIKIVEKWSTNRLERFLVEYKTNDQQALKNYRLKRAPKSGYENYRIKLQRASYNGDPDVNVQVIHEVTLYYGSEEEKYQVEQVFTFVDEPTKSIENDMSNFRNWFMEWKYSSI